MKKKKMLAVGLAALLLGGVASAPLALARGPVDYCPDGYVVQPGNNAWTLSSTYFGDPTIWQTIVNENPLLQAPGRVKTRNGKTVLLMYPGECLHGLDQYGNITVTAEPEERNVVPATPAGNLAEVTSNSPAGDPPSWFWWVLGGAGLVGLGYLVRRMLKADAATSGPAMVPGGIDDNLARERFGAMGTVQRFTVLNTDAGRIWGTLNVSYANGRVVPRQLNGERAYQARVRHENGSEEVLYMLQACGNDLRYGGISRYLPGPNFRFEADHAVEPAPAAAEAASDELVLDSVAPSEDGEVTFEFRQAKNKADNNLVRITGIDVDELSFVVGPKSTTLRYRETKKSKG